MKQIKEIGKKLFFRPPLQTVIIAFPSFALVIYVLIGHIGGPLAYLSYLLSAYALIITLTGFPNIVRAIREYVANHPLAKNILRVPFIKRFREDVRFRTEVSLHQGFTINLLYIVVKMASGVYYRSLWFISLAVYYALLAVMRFLLLYRRTGPKGTLSQEIELHRYRLCGVSLLFMNAALAGIVAFMVHQNRGYDYPGVLIYAMAAYSFYAVIIAVVNVIKFRKHGSPILSAAKAINLVAAMVSILSLETAMLSRFGTEDDPLFRAKMIGYTGGGVCILVLGIAALMIVKSSKQIKRMKNI